MNKLHEPMIIQNMISEYHMVSELVTNYNKNIYERR